MSLDHTPLQEALNLARLSLGDTEPNPAVGAVIVDQMGNVISRGYHKRAGEPHAEVEAIRAAKDADLSRCILFVTLEPCCHHGRTPPCTDAILAAGIKEVVYGFGDPNPKVSGRGDEILRSAGVSITYKPLPEINRFYSSYAYWTRTGLPWRVGKLAVTSDGFVAGLEGERVFISGERAGEFTQRMRREANALMTTVETVISDDPVMNARIPKETVKKRVFILDRQSRFPKDAVLRRTARELVLYRETGEVLLGAETSVVPSIQGHLDLKAIAQDLGQRGIHKVWIEAGGRFTTSVLMNGWLNEFIIYRAPRALGKGIRAFSRDLGEVFQKYRKIEEFTLGEDKVERWELV